MNIVLPLRLPAVVLFLCLGCQSARPNIDRSQLVIDCRYVMEHLDKYKPTSNISSDGLRFLTPKDLPPSIRILSPISVLSDGSCVDILLPRFGQGHGYLACISDAEPTGIVGNNLKGFLVRKEVDGLWYYQLPPKSSPPTRRSNGRQHGAPVIFTLGPSQQYGKQTIFVIQ